MTNTMYQNTTPYQDRDFDTRDKAGTSVSSKYSLFRNTDGCFLDIAMLVFKVLVLLFHSYLKEKTTPTQIGMTRNRFFIITLLSYLEVS